MSTEESKAAQKIHKCSWNRVENVFFLNGVASLVGWSAVLSSLDYFSTIYKDYNVYLFFPVPLYIAYVIMAFLFHYLATKFKIETLIKVGIVASNISLVLFFIASVVCKQTPALGFYLSLFFCFSLGFFNNAFQLSFYFLMNYFDIKTVSRYTIGTSISSIVMIVLRAILAAIFINNQSYVPMLIYFLIAILFNFFTLFCNIRLFKSQKYIDCIRQEHENHGNSERSFFKGMWQTCKCIHPYPLIIFFDVMITFTLFPNLGLAKKTSLGTLWTIILMIFIFNLGDFAGKLIADFRGSFTSSSIIYTLASRLIFYLTIPLMLKQFTQDDFLLNNDIFPYVNMFLFSLTNGLVLSKLLSMLDGSFILAFEKSKPEFRKYASVVCGILLEIGIMVGTFLAIPLQIAVNPDI